MATEFWLPDQVRKEEFVERQIGVALVWTRLLQSVDTDLSLVFVKHSDEAKSVGLEPGRWHVRKRNRGLPDSYMPITTPGGGYREPDQGVLDELSRRHMWRTPGVTSQQMRDHQAKWAATEREKDLHREQLQDMTAEDFRAARRVAGESIYDRKWGRGKPTKEKEDGT